MSNTLSLPLALELELPWHEDAAQEEKFKKTVKRILIPLLLLFLIIPWLPVFEKAYKESENEIVKTKIVLEPVVIEEPEPPKPVKKKKKPKKIAEKKADKVDKRPPPPSKDVKKEEVAKEQGLAGLSDQLNAMRKSMDLTKLQKKNVTKSTQGKVTRATKSVLGQDNLTRKSEGIEVDDAMMNDQALALAMHESTKLDGFIGGSGAGDPSAKNSGFYSNLRGQRSDESIRRVFEAGKSQVYMYYMRALRDDPSLAGTFVFDVVIEPNGKISQLQLVSSELQSPDLESVILNKLRQLDFGSEDVDPRKLTYKFNFLPG